MKILLSLCTQFKELERIGYSGFAFGFYNMDVQEVHTTDCAACISPEVVDYLRSLIIASKYIVIVCL